MSSCLLDSTGQSEFPPALGRGNFASALTEKNSNSLGAPISPSSYSNSGTGCRESKELGPSGILFIANVIESGIAIQPMQVEAGLRYGNTIERRAVGFSEHRLSAVVTGKKKTD